ncbi:MAG: hypothetical protein JW871_02400 [Endomicrobiales bacterium]|nr:hypothetical protein [Endomicrobiales bacterium]
MKKRNIIIFLILLIPFFCEAKRFTDTDAMYYWFYSQQVPEGLVLNEDKDNFTVEEEALSAIVFLNRGHVHRAEKILDFFANLEKKISETGEFKGFYRYYQIDGQPLSSEILATTQLWLLVAINEYTLTTKNKRYLHLSKAISKIILDLEGIEAGISAGYWGTTPLTYYTCTDNLLAISVFSRLWKWSKISEYRYAAWRTYEFINRFLWDAEEKKFRHKIYQPDFDITDSFWSTLILGESYFGWKDFQEPTDLYNKILLALVYFTYGEEEKSRSILGEVEKNIIWSRKNWGSAGLPVVKGGREIDVFTTAWYLLVLDGVNPFEIDPDFWKNKVMLSPEQRQFSGDDFEEGKLQTLLAYPMDLIEERRCRVIVDWDTENIKTGQGALRVFFTPATNANAAEAIVTREFLERQDFSSFSNLKIWMKASATARIFQSKLQVNVGFVDSDGELWISPNLSIIGRKGFINSFSFPNGWERHKGSHGNNIFDVERIQKLKILIYQPEDTPWQLYFDDLVLK